MADLKISQLPAATTPVVGTEVLPIVQSGTTSQVSINSATGITRPFTSGGVVYASSTSALATGSALTFDGTNLGIGTTSPSTKLDAVAANPANQLGGQIAVSSSTAYATGNVSGITFRANDSSASLSPYASIQMKTTGDNAGALTFVTRSNAGAYDERMRLDASGNLGLGVTPSAGGATANYKLFEVGAGGGASIYAATGQSIFGTNIAWSGGTANYKASSLTAMLYSQELGFHTWKIAPSGTAGNAITFTQAMTLDASGQLLVGLTSGYATASVQSYQTSAGNWAFGAKSTASAGNTYFITFNTSDGTQRGYIYYNGAATIYSTSSDQRLKNNIVDAPSAVSDISAIKIRSFDWKENGQHQKYGVVAQELQTIAPDAISTPPEKNGMLGVDYSLLVPMMIKSIQEQQAIIESLTTRLTALEGRA